MCPQLFSCPLCARPSFESLDSLRIGLVSVATRPLMCPICNETLLGIEKLTIHLFGHSINTLESSKLPKENQVKINKPQDTANVNNFVPQSTSKESSNELIFDKQSRLLHQSSSINFEQNLESYKLLSSNNTNPCVIQAENSTSINKPHQRDALQLASTWTNDLLLHPDRENSTCILKSSVNIGNCKNMLSNQLKNQVLSAETDKKIDSKKLTLHIPDTRHAPTSIEPEEKKGERKVSSSFSNNDIHALPHLKSLRNLASSEKTERCNLCGFHFPDYNILMLHKQLVHTIAENDVNVKSEVLLKNYPCHLCHKVFKIRGSLMVHMRVAHTNYNSGLLSNEKDSNQVGCRNGFNCPTCGKNFRKEQHVTQHLKTHEAKQWECDVCSKMFTTKYFLKKHKRLHSGEMPYKCDICNKTFTFQQSYHKHRLYHKDDKPHTCTTCGRSFKELSTLHNHERIHTGEKPFACETCGKCFRQRVSYLVHRRIHTGVMPYTCTACGKSFRYKVSQRTHKCPAAVDTSESLEQSESHLLPVTKITNENSDLSLTSREKTPLLSDPPLSIDPNQVNKFILIVNSDGQTVLKRESDLNLNNASNNNKINGNENSKINSWEVKNSTVNLISQDNGDNVLRELSQRNNRALENLFINPRAIDLPVTNYNSRSNLFSPSVEMKQLRLSSPTNEDIFMRPDDPFRTLREIPTDLHKDIKHAIDGILKERYIEDNPLSLETINEDSFKQLLYGIDKET
ncbi:zinc finger protein 239 [Chelonus insularis]|uniref:zinc finger protein 239 n=1 Tax=Chelonus insularis TaxID=460826 RepID=UPI00158CBF85|nr:zinc finger protein 239 [Chelonus insularis]